jgi:Flp pilus assembly secretin CpaC
MATSLVWGLLVAGTVGGGCGPAPAKPEVPRQFQFDCRITKADGAGGKKVLSEPRLVSLEGKKASFLIGSEVPVPVAGEMVQFAETGLRMDMVVTEAKSGMLSLDVTASETRPEPAAGGGVQLRTHSVRTIQFVEPMESLKLKVGPYTFKVQAQPVN